MQLLLWISLAVIFYIYLGYPLTMLLLAAIRPKPLVKGHFQPTVTVLIAAYNEVQHILDTIRNKLELEYPADKLRVVVISDGSTDGTDEIVKSIDDPRVRLLRQEPRAGKTAALNMAAGEVDSQIIVFSDANSIYDKNALRRLMENFRDPRVGYVTGKMIYTNPEGSPIGDGCSAYMKYENWLRRLETAAGSVVGVDGGIDAVRRPLYRPMRPDQLPDFVLPLKVAEQGYRVIYEPEAILKEQSLKAPGDEYRMRVRVGLRALWALWDMRGLLSVHRYGLFAFQLWVHKVLRYLCFAFLLAALLTSWALIPVGTLYLGLFVLQLVCYLGAWLFPVLQPRGILYRPMYLAYYFALLNLASAHAFSKFLRGQKQVMWTPRKG